MSIKTFHLLFFSMIIAISFSYSSTTDHDAVAQQVAARLPLLATYMADSTLITIATKRMSNPQTSPNRERLKNCDWLEALLTQQSQTSAPLLRCFAEPPCSNPLLVRWWEWAVRHVYIDEEEEEIKRKIQLILTPENMGRLAQRSDSHAFWHAVEKLDEDTERELERFKNVARAMQKEQKQ